MAKWACRILPLIALLLGAGLVHGHHKLSPTIAAARVAAAPAEVRAADAPAAPVLADLQDLKETVTMGAFTTFKNTAAIWQTTVHGVEVLRRDITGVLAAVEDVRVDLEVLRAEISALGLRTPPASAPPAKAKPVQPPAKAKPIKQDPKKAQLDAWVPQVRRAQL